MKTPGERSIREVVQEWRPRFNDKWRRWIRESYTRYTSTEATEHFEGIRDFAVILGDSYAPELCALVALHGVRLAKTEKERNSLESHIRIITNGLGIEQYKTVVPRNEGIPAIDFADRSKWLINYDAWRHWRDQKLEEFGGDRQVAAEFSVRLACIHAGLFTGQTELTFESVCDASLWQMAQAEPSGNQ